MKKYFLFQLTKPLTEEANNTQRSNRSLEMILYTQQRTQLFQELRFFIF